MKGQNQAQGRQVLGRRIVEGRSLRTVVCYCFGLIPTGNNIPSSQDFQQRAAESQGEARAASTVSHFKDSLTGNWLNHALG